MVSSYPGQEWNLDGEAFHEGNYMVYCHDGILGSGQYIYNFDDGVNPVCATGLYLWNTS